MTKARVLRSVATRGTVPKLSTLERLGVTADELHDALWRYIDRYGIQLHDGDTPPVNITKLAVAVHNLRQLSRAYL